MSDMPESFKCKHADCCKTYPNKYNLQRHVESSHSKLKRFRCRYCGKCLSSQQNLREHRYTHTKLKPYACPEPLCGKTFRQSSQLSNHKKLHKELLLASQRQNEFKELKVRIIQLTQIISKKSRQEDVSFVTGSQEMVCLPGVSGPQFSVVLPGLPLSMFINTGAKKV